MFWLTLAETETTAGARIVVVTDRSQSGWHEIAASHHPGGGQAVIFRAPCRRLVGAASRYNVVATSSMAVATSSAPR
jgi:hypothetical protein